MATYDEQIKIKEGQIVTKNEQIKALQADIVTLKTEIGDLYAQIVKTEAPLAGVTFTLRFGNNNVPTLSGTSQAAAVLIAATGRRPAAVEMDGVLVTASGNNINLSVPGETDPKVIATKLGNFGAIHKIALNADQAKSAATGNETQADRFQSIFDLQTGIINTMTTMIPPLLPAPTTQAPAFTGDPVVQMDGLVATVTWTATGTPAPTFTMDWGDDTGTMSVTSPATHTYSEDGIYTAVLSASNGTSPNASKSIEVTAEA
jgi:PKD repeat protein